MGEVAFESRQRRIIADSGGGFGSKSECLADIDRVKGSKDAPVKSEPPAVAGG